jgi:hypothetical protein
MGKPSFWDTAASMGDNIVGGIPGVGNIYSGAKALNAFSEYSDAAEGSEEQAEAMRDMETEAIGAIPLVGNAVSYGGLMYDVLAYGNDTSDNLMNRVLGGEDKYPSDYSEEGGEYHEH